MFRRETARERTLLRLIEQQQQTISDLLDRIAWQAGKPWALPPHPENIVPITEVERTWTWSPEEAA